MLQLFEVRKAYKTAGFEQIALDDVSIAFRDNEFVAILGPSGSGKTTLLNIIGGLDHYDSGDLIIDGISTSKYRDRDWDAYRNNRIGFIFQSYNLITHQSVLVNVEMALTLSGVNKAERREKALEALKEVGLEEHANKKPTQLSGGQMQRVAIARALINDPEIVLADEPTGALDSKTSVQIMGLLTEIAKNRLVIMVTHNPELAEQYANRTVNLYDGCIEQDSNPFIPSEDDLPSAEKTIRKTAMSFLTAISLSFTNLMTKKGRTIMTSFAGSIGIIGIAAILSLANGVNNYIKSVEENTLTVYPLSISSAGMNLTSMISLGISTGDESAAVEEEEADPRLKELKQISNTFSSIGQNDLAALKLFLDDNGGGITEHINSIEYSYSVTPQIYSTDTSEKAHQVNPDMLTRMMGMDGGGISSFMTMGLGTGTNAFSPLVENTRLLVEQYDVVTGRWPENYNELILVLSGDDGISDYVLYTMGLRDIKELEEMLQQFNNEEDVTPPDDVLEVGYDQVMAVQFKLVLQSDYYTYDETYGVWTNRQNDTEYMKQLVDSGETLSIVGIMRAKPDATATSLSSGLYYPASLTRYLMDKSAEKQIVQDQLANRDVNVFTGKTFEEEKEAAGMGDFDLSDIMTVDTAAISNAFRVDASKLNIDLSGVLDPTAVMANTPPPPELNINDFLEGAELTVPTEQVSAVATKVLEDYLAYCFANGITNSQDIVNGFPAYLQRPEVQVELAIIMGANPEVGQFGEQLQGAFNLYIQTMMSNYMMAVMENMQKEIQRGLGAAMQQFAAQMSTAMSVDQNAFMNAFQFNMDPDQLSQVMMAMMSTESNTYDNNIRKLGYASLDKPSGINIYPIDFESKQNVIEILDKYNSDMKAAEDDDKVIVYTDIVGLLMNSVTTIINMISAVLVAFVAISLVVSSIMIGVITYISVLERKKEIGILRAIGARKSDIGNVFNAETLIVGLVAGLMGIGITLLLSIPANIIIYSQFDVQNVVLLPVWPALALVAISMGLTFMSGLIPSSAASRRDPVEALRSE
jgi:ABC-type lipoprotein export system ATPase subunit/cell division protein FtsX